MRLHEATWADSPTIKLVREDGIKFGTTNDGSDWGTPVAWLYRGHLYPTRWSAEVAEAAAKSLE